MNNNYEPKYRVKDRLLKIKNRLEYLLDQDIVKAYLKWKTLDIGKQSQIEVAWTDYYIKAKNSPEAERYWKIRDAWKANDFKTVQKLAKEASENKKRNNYPPQPSSFDPSEFKRDYFCQQHDQLIEEQNNLKKNSNVDVEDIFS